MKNTNNSNKNDDQKHNKPGQSTQQRPTTPNQQTKPGQTTHAQPSHNNPGKTNKPGY